MFLHLKNGERKMYIKWYSIWNIRNEISKIKWKNWNQNGNQNKRKQRIKINYLKHYNVNHFNLK